MVVFFQSLWNGVCTFWKGLMWILSQLLMLPIRFYRKCISPFTPPSCRFTPTCSRYAMDALRIHGPFMGTYLAVRRILRCHPWGGSGYDPVPGTEQPATKTFFVDVHTHRVGQQADACCLCQQSDDRVPDVLPARVFWSAGLHPWKADKDWQQKVDGLVARWSSPDCVAVGECGLDYSQDHDREWQEQAFVAQVKASEAYRHPLIIHCVKAMDDLLRLHKRMNPSQAWIVHGFRGKPQQAQQLLRQGLHLSLGKHFNPETARMIPADRLWMETDEADADIKQIYEAVAAARGESVDVMRERIWRRFVQVFSISRSFS